MTMHKTKLTTIAIVISTILGGVAGCNNDSNDASKSVVKDDNYYKSLAEGLVAKMTVDEKIKMLIGPGYTTTPGSNNSRTYGTDYSQITNVKKIVPGAAGYINGVYNESTGLDIPAAKLVDGPAGIRIYPTREGQEGLDPESGTYYATAFPTGTLLASTWNAELAKEVGAAAGNEAKEYGVDFWLAPGMNIQRNPLNGRNFEYYSEDPLISGVIAASVVDGAQSEGIGATIKHFAANNSETNRRTVNAVVTPRALREIYLRGFEYAVEKSHPWALMTSYNSINGVNAGERTDLITNILRDEWGFKGFAMSDWWSGWDPVALVKAGTDVIQPGGAYRIFRGADWLTVLQDAYKNNQLSDEIINRDVTRTLTQVLKAPSGQNYQYSNNPDLNGHAQIAKQAAEEGMVLLKNEGSVLPIAASQKIASFGIGQINTFKGGTGSGDVHSSYIKNIYDGLAEKYTIDEDIGTFYQEFFTANKTVSTDVFGVSEVISCQEPDVSVDQVNAAAASSDVAVITISRNAGEGSDRTASAGDYLLTTTETTLIDNVTTAFHAQSKKVVVILNIGGVIDTTAWKDKVDGILLAYQPGQEAGNAVADIVSGVVSPSGKLAQTFPASYADVPSSATFPGVTESTYDNAGPVDPNVNTSITPKVADYNQYYNEDIYVGYRYYNTFNKGVAYPFGYGLSYTTFSFGEPTVSNNSLNSQGKSGSVTITANVTNTGSVAGKEVAQVYISAPEVKLKKPNIELKAFAKTDKLAAGSAQQLTLNISAETLASFDEAHNQWIVEPGLYKVYVSSSSDVAAVEPVTFTVNKEIVVENTTPNALALQSGFADKSFITVTE